MSSINLSEEQLSELAKCYNDPIYFIENYGWIEIKEQSKIVPAILYPYQKEMLTWLVNRENGLILKSRRVGGSTIVGLYLAWLINFRRGVNALLLSRTEKDAIKLLAKVKFAYFNIKKHTSDNFALAEDASWMLNPTPINNQQLFATGWYDDEGNLLSTSEVASLTTTSESGRGESATFVFIDEMAFIDDQEGASRAARITTTRGGHWLAVSTPNGVGDKFYEWCMRADRNENRTYNFRRVHWSEAGMTKEMIENATEGLSEASVMQEMEMEFISSGDPVFSHLHLSSCYKPIEDYKEVQDSIDRYRKLVMTSKDYMYYTGVDTAVGKLSKKDSKRDYHSFTALTQSGIQAYAFHSKTHTLTEWAGNIEQLAGQSVKHEGMVSGLHKLYPGLMHVEVNGPGQAVIINHILPEDGRSNIVSKQTNFKTKEQLIRQLIIAVESHAIVITDQFTYQCMLVYQRGTTVGTYTAPNGAYDDPVISLALAWDALLRSGAIEFSWGRTADDLKQNVKSGDDISNIEFSRMGYGPAVLGEIKSTDRMTNYGPDNNGGIIIDSDFDLSKLTEPEFNAKR